MAKQNRQAKQAENEEKKKAIESQKEELRLLAEREIEMACREEEKHVQEQSTMMSEYQQSMERAMAHYSEIEAFRQAEEEKLRQVAEQEEQKERARAEVERLRGKYCLSSDSETQTPPDQLSTLLAEIERLKLELKSSRFSFRMLEGNDLRTKFYTGLPSWPVFVYVFTFVSRDLNSRGNHALCLEDQFFLALVY